MMNEGHLLRLRMCFSPQLHIVHMKSHYADLTTALRDSEGVAVLGFFYEVSIESPVCCGPD